MNWWPRFKAWFSAPAPRSADRQLQDTQPIPSSFERISADTQKRMLDQVPDPGKDQP